MSRNIITDWLRFLDLEEYSEGFIENGYDDLETVKLIERDDLIAIGVARGDHQEYLLASVRILRERGAAWVYLVFSEPPVLSSADIAEGEWGATYYGSDGNTTSGTAEGHTYYGSDGTESCLQSDETYSSSSSGERRPGPQGVIQQYTDATGSKRFILNVEVTPEHKPRASSSLQPGPVLARLGPAAARAAAEEEIQREEAGVTAHARQRPGPGDKRSIFSQLGQWLCHGGGAGGGGGEGLYATTESRPVRAVPAAAARPVISVASAEAGQLVYTPLHGARGRGRGLSTLSRSPRLTPPSAPPPAQAASKLWTPLVPHRQYRDLDTINLPDTSVSASLSRAKVNTSIRYCHHLGRGSESQV